MHTILEVLDGPRAGHKLVLLPGQIVAVGRSAAAEFSCEQDMTMSSIHFRLQNDRTGCVVDDLNSKHGTFVNGQRVTRAVLRNGDSVVAGSTKFQLRCTSTAADGDAKKTAEFRAVEGLPVANYQAMRHRSGITEYRGSTLPTPPANVAQWMSAVYQQILIVDVNKLPERSREPFPAAEYLMDWLPEEARAMNSPVVLTSPEQMRRIAVVDEAWGKDALVAIYCEPEEDLPLDLLRRLAGLFYRPSVLRPQLREASADFVRGVTAEITALLVEAEDANVWSLFAGQDLAPLLEKSGLIAGKGGP